MLLEGRKPFFFFFFGFAVVPSSELSLSNSTSSRITFHSNYQTFVVDYSLQLSTAINQRQSSYKY